MEMNYYSYWLGKVNIAQLFACTIIDMTHSIKRQTRVN